MADNVNHPTHYADKKIEVIDYIRDTLPPAGFVDYCLGNVLKYVSRWRKKGGVEDLKKAEVYLGWAIEQADTSNAKVPDYDCLSCADSSNNPPLDATADYMHYVLPK